MKSSHDTSRSRHDRTPDRNRVSILLDHNFHRNCHKNCHKMASPEEARAVSPCYY